MSDARIRSLIRDAEGGDREARRALLLELRRARDPALLAAAELRARLRGLVFEILARTVRPAHVRCAWITTALADALSSELPDGLGWGFRSLGRGTWFAHPCGVGVLAVRDGDRLLVAVRGAFGKVSPGGMYDSLRSLGKRPEALAARLGPWVRDPTRREPNRDSWHGGLVETTAQVAADLCRFEAYAGPRGYGLWSALHPEPLWDPSTPLDPRRRENPASKPQRRQLDALCAAAQLAGEALEALLLEHVGHRRAEALSRPEAAHLITTLEAWTGAGEELSANQQRRIHQLRERAGLSPAAFGSLLADAVGVEHLDAVPASQFSRLLARLQRLESTPAAPAPAVSAASARAARYLPHNGYADVEPIRTPPRERWRTKLEGRDPLRDLLPTPQGLVAVTSRRVVVCDLETGAVRHDFPQAAGVGVLDGVLLLLESSRTLRGFDLASGDELYAERLKGGKDSFQVDGRLLLTSGAYSAVTYRIDDPRRPPQLLWEGPGEWWPARNRCCVPPFMPPGGSALVDGRVVLVKRFTRGVEVRDAEGREVCAFPDAETCSFVDGTGLVVTESQRLQLGGIETRTRYVELPSGRVGWERWGESEAPVALTPHSVVLRKLGGEEPLIALDRGSGEPRVQVPGAAGVYEARHVWACRDVVYAANSTTQVVDAWSTEYGRLWSWSTGRKVDRYSRTEYPVLAPGEGRLFAAVSQREVVCLEG